MKKLGKLEEIKDLRKVWPHEALDFTPWLASEENVALLSDAVGIDITIDETESSVGTFNVDIFASEIGTDRKIIIENQLEDTNHDHLGKLITYASGKSADIVIWLVKHAREEHIYKGMGDIICCLDESNSTKGEAAAWGKAVAMTLLEIAAESRRSFAMIHFAGSSSCQVDIFRPGEYTLEDKLTAAETFLGGGTNFERPIREAIHLMESDGFEKADVVFITDGECELSDVCRQELQTAQAAHHFTVTGILLDKGQSGMNFSLKPFCQKIYRTSELAGDGIMQSVISLRV